MTVFECRAVQLAAILMLAFITIQNFERLRRLQELVQLTCHEVLWIDGFTHPGVPAYAVQPSGHMRTAEKFGFALQSPRIAIAEATLQSAVDEQIRVT